MQLYPELRIQAALEAMRHVIVPALDASDKLAQEQARLVIGMLEMANDRLAVQYDYDTYELSRLVSTAESVLAPSDGALGEADEVADLQRALASGRDVLARAAAGPSELRDTLRVMKAALGAVTSSAYASGGDARRRVSAAVLALTEDLLPLVRASYAGHGFDTEAASGPGVAELLESREVRR